MPDKQMYATAPRGNWPWVAAILAVVIVAAALAWVLVRDDSDATGPEGGGGGQDTGGSSIDATGTVVPASGCLGGEGDLNEAVRIAQQEAPLTGDGAAAFLATFWRWYGSSSTSQLELDEVGEDVISGDVPSDFFDRDPSGDGESFAISFVNKHYRVLAVEGDRATVEFTVDATYGEPEVRVASALIAYAEVVDGEWHWAGWDEQGVRAAAGDDNGRTWRAEIDTAGVPFQEAC